MTGDRPIQLAHKIFSIKCRFRQSKAGPSRFNELAHKIFSIKCRFRQSKAWPSKFNEACARGCQREVYFLKVVIYPLLFCLE